MKTSVVKNILFGTILAYPYIGGYFPVIRVSGIDFQPYRVLFIIYTLCFLFTLLVKEITISNVTKAYYIYISYTILVSVFFSVFDVVNTINYLLFGFFLVLIDNIDFVKKDLKTFNKILMIVGVGVFIASFIQVFINPYFYSGNQQHTINFIDKYRVIENIFRNGSIFVGIGPNEGGIAIGFLSLFFLFQNSNKFNFTSTIFFLLMIFCSFVTYARYVWIMPLIGIFYFVYYYRTKNKKKVQSLILYFMIIAFLFYLTSYFYLSTIVQTRLLNEGTASARSLSTYFYFQNYFLKSPIFGFGFSSWQDEAFIVNEKLGGIGIHVGLVDLLYIGGIIGFSLYVNMIYCIYKKGIEIKNKFDNPYFIVFCLAFIAINSTAVFIDFKFYGYIISFFYLSIYNSLLKNGIL